MALISGVHHISLKCEDLEMFEKAMKFYHETLEMPIVRAWGEGENQNAMLSTGTGLMEIMSRGRTSEHSGTVNHFALITSDVDGCVKAVRNAGYQITMEPRDIVIGSVPPLPARIAFCVGPVGEEIEFFNEK